MPKKNEEEEKKSKAIIIGINEYLHQDREYLKPLKGAVNDAEEMYKVLKEMKTFDITDNDILIDEYATCRKIREAISNLLLQTVPYDLVLFYFSGHGMVDGFGNGYLAPYDMNPKKPFVYGINMKELSDVISISTQEKILTIIDCCYSGITAKGETLKGSDIIGPDKLVKYKKKMEGENFKITMASSEANKKSKEISNKKLPHEKKASTHGIFTFHILEGLYGYGGADKSGLITLASLKEHVTDRLMEADQKMKEKLDSASSLTQIKIGINPKIRDDFIETNLKVAEECKKKGKSDLAFIINACKYLHKVSEFTEKTERFKKIKKYVCTKLDQHNAAVNLWLSLNTEEIRLKRGLEDLYKELKLASSYLYFDDIKTIFEVPDNPYKLLLYELGEEIKKTCSRELKKFIDNCTPIIQKLIKTPQPQSQPN